MPLPFISLTTDFGTGSHFVGTIKGVISNINPDAKIIDITHDIKPFDVLEAAFVVQNAAPFFPKPTIHVVIVDPGVGSERRPLLMSGENHYFIAPDNGVLTRVMKEDLGARIVSIEEEHYFLKTECSTFHGRDVFAPVAAWLSKSYDSAQFGEPITDYKQLDIPKPKIVQDRTVRATVLFVDRFGNLVTNLERKMFEHARNKFPGNSIKIKIKNTILSSISSHFFSVKKGEILALFGSMEMMEIASREENASHKLGMKPGDTIHIHFGA